MIDQLIKLVEQHAGEAIVQNKSIPNQHNSAAIQDVAQQIFSGLQGQVSQGNLQRVTSLFNNSDANAITSSPMVSQMIATITQSMASKFGVSPQAAQSIASTIIPQVMKQFVSKTNNPNDGDFDLQDMMRNLSGNNNLNIGDILGKFSGGNTKGIGDVGDILGKLF